jgi:hypothetical protein
MKVPKGKEGLERTVTSLDREATSAAADPEIGKLVEKMVGVRLRHRAAQNRVGTVSVRVGTLSEHETIEALVEGCKFAMRMRPDATSAEVLACMVARPDIRRGAMGLPLGGDVDDRCLALAALLRSAGIACRPAVVEYGKNSYGLKLIVEEADRTSYVDLDKMKLVRGEPR